MPLLLGAAALLALSLGRATALRAGVPDVFAGAVFATALLAISLSVPAVRRNLASAPRPAALLLGGAIGSALLVPGALTHDSGAVGLASFLPRGYFALWVPLIGLISAAEETALRGWLQPLAREAWGPAAAIAICAAIFAAIHAPLYGWIALPLDLGVGILIGCLREYTGSVAACGVAHVVADLGHWWLP